MSFLLTESRKLITDVIGILGSREKQKVLLKTPLYANAMYLMAANITNALFGFIFWIIAARFYSAQDVGMASAAISAAGLLAIIAALGSGVSIIRFLPSSKEPNKLINTGFSTVGLLALVVAIIFIAGLDVWSPALLFLRANPIYLAVFILCVPLTHLSALSDSSFMANRKAGFTLVRSIVYNVSRIILPIILAIYFGSFGIFGAWTLALGIAFAAAISWLMPQASPGYQPRPVFDKQIIREIVPYAFPNYIANLFWAIPGFTLPLLVINRLSAEKNAYFYMAWAMSGILMMIPSAITMSLLAEGSYAETELRQHAWRSIKMTFLILVPAVILLILLADKLLLVYGGIYAQKGATLLRWLALATLPLAINAIFITVKRVQKQLKPVILLTGINVVLTLSLSYFLLPVMGIDGVGIALLGSQGLTAIMAGGYLVSSKYRVTSS